MVRASDELGVAEAAARFGVGTASVKRWRRLVRSTGSCVHRPMGGDRRSSAARAARVQEAVDDKPDRTLREIVAELVRGGMRRFPISTVSRTLKRLGFALRRKATIALERSSARVAALRASFLARQGRLDTSRLVFLDESGLHRGMHRPRAWRRRRSVVFERVVRNYGTVTTVLGAISTSGIVAAMHIEGATTGEVFLAFLRDVLLPKLHPGDVVVMDNLGAHRVAEVRALLEQGGVGVLYLPPYSPDLNPIECAWAKLKEAVRGLAPSTLNELHTAIATAWQTITPTDCLGWTRHCGYSIPK